MERLALTFPVADSETQDEIASWWAMEIVKIKMLAIGLESIDCAAEDGGFLSTRVLARSSVLVRNQICGGAVRG